jgi:hypothetical protein
LRTPFFFFFLILICAFSLPRRTTAPLGMQDVFNGDQGGSGLCSIKYTAYGDYKSACYDS